MRRYKLNSRNGLCNFFAEYISNEISENGKYDTVISVVDCESLLIIKGHTEKEQIQDVKEIVNKFISIHWSEFTFTDLQKISSLDMITFGEEKKLRNRRLKFRFERDVQFPRFDENIVDTPLVTSDFPYGFSKYYLKMHIFLFMKTDPNNVISERKIILGRKFI